SARIIRVETTRRWGSSTEPSLQGCSSAGHTANQVDQRDPTKILQLCELLVGLSILPQHAKAANPLTCLAYTCEKILRQLSRFLLTSITNRNMFIADCDNDFG